MLNGAVVLVAVVVFTIGLAWVAGGYLERRRVRAGAEADAESLTKVAEALTKGVGLLTALIAVLAARGGGIGRLVSDGGPYPTAALACVVASILLAFVAWSTVAVAGRQGIRLWVVAVAASIALFAVSFLAIVQGSTVADSKLQRPTVTVEHDGDKIAFTAAIDLLRADGFMRTTVYGYPADGGPRELLLNSTSGPDAEGRATFSGTTKATLDGYEVVEVRAFRGDVDPGCERPKLGPLPARTGPAACASVWLEPLTR